MKTHVKNIFTDLSQTFFIKDARLGISMFALLMFFSPKSAICSLLCAVISSLTARQLQPNRTLLEGGLFGMNGFFFGLAVSSLFLLNTTSMICLVVGSVFTSVLVLFLYRVILPWQFPLFVLPYVVSVAVFWLLKNEGSGMILVPTPSAPDLTLYSPFLVAFCGIFNGISVILFQSNPVMGILLVLSVAVFHQKAAALLVMGSTIATVAALFLNLNLGSIYLGYYSFSGALASVALGVGYKGFSLLELGVAGLFSLFLTAAASSLFFKLGILPLALPYIGIVWMGLGIKAIFGENQLEVAKEPNQQNSWVLPRRERKYAKT